MNHLDTKTPGLLTRIAAWEVLQAVSAGAFAEIALRRALKKHLIKGLDKGLVMEIAYGSIRQRKLLDSWVDFLGKVPAKKQPPKLRWLFHLGLYQILFMERVPDSAAVNTSVQIAKNHKFTKLAPVVNAVLRSAIRNKNLGVTPPIPNLLEEKLAHEQSLPVWFISLLIDWVGVEKAELIARASNKKTVIDLRVNRLKVNIQNVQELMNGQQIQCKSIEDCPNGLEVSDGSGDLRNWPGYHDGYWSVQDRAAQLVAPLVDPKKGDRVLDACAAPGGKTTHLAELMDGIGELWAVDRSLERLKKVVDNADRLGLKCINILQEDVSILFQKKPSWKNYFQRILLDVPCSGLGTLARNPDARWRVNPANISDLIILQAKLLDGIFPLLSKGGRIVYSTCTIHPEENEKQIQKFVNNHSEMRLVLEKQILPNFDGHGDGFYIAVMDMT